MNDMNHKNDQNMNQQNIPQHGICNRRNCNNKTGGFKTRSGKVSVLCQYHYNLQSAADQKRFSKNDNIAKGICIRSDCNNRTGGFVTKKGKASVLCKHHYDIQTRKDNKKKKDPKQMEQRKEYQKIHRPDVKYRKKKREEDEKAFLRHNADVQAEWRKNNPERSKELLDNRNRSTNAILTQTKKSAKVRGKEWKLSDGYAKYLFQQNCFYCGITTKQRNRLNNIDRIDNDIGYLNHNVVPCCSNCNNMKHKYSKDVFLKKCEHICVYNKMTKNGNLWNNVFDDHPSNNSYDAYKKSANKRGKIFAIDDKLFDRIKKKDCYICGKKNTSFHSNGIDRINNDIGYEKHNIIGCCGDCNKMKKDLTFPEFMAHILKIHQHQVRLKRHI